MDAFGRIKVLVVDDSLLYREVISRGLSSDERLVVVAKAVDPFDARDKILQYEPDVLTCDVEMPRMNGVEFIRRLLPQYPVPVIMVSTASHAVLDAMAAGAVDFVAKPDMKSPKGVESFLTELIGKVKAAGGAKIAPPRTAPVRPHDAPAPSAVLPVNPNRVIAIGSSTGGTEAVFQLLKQLPADGMPGMIIVQHIPPVFSRMFAERLHSQTAFHVKEASNGDVLEPGRILIAPGDQHVRLKKTNGTYKAEVYRGERINGHCPSVDVLFDSVAREAGANAVGIILTGMGSDGAKGLLAMRKNGARTIGQDESSSVVYGMPKAAFEIGAVEKQAPLSHIPQLLIAALLR